MGIPRDLFEDPQSTVLQGLLWSELVVVNHDPLIVVAIRTWVLSYGKIKVYLRSAVFTSIDLDPFFAVLGHTVGNHHTESGEDRLRFNEVPQSVVHNVIGSLHYSQTTEEQKLTIDVKQGVFNYLSVM